MEYKNRFNKTNGHLEWDSSSIGASDIRSL